MTRDEAMALKDGDHVEVLRGRRWCLCRVECERYSGDVLIAGCPDYLYVRRVGKTVAGQRFPRAMAWINGIRATEYRPEPANVFADWLDDNGHPEAASALRQAFPLGDRSEGGQT